MSSKRKASERRHKSAPARLQQGDVVRLDGTLQTQGHQGECVDFKGDVATVVGTNPEYQRAGERYVSVETEDGSFISVPANACRSARSRTVIGVSGFRK